VQHLRKKTQPIDTPTFRKGRGYLKHWNSFSVEIRVDSTYQIIPDDSCRELTVVHHLELDLQGLAALFSLGHLIWPEEGKTRCPINEYLLSVRMTSEEPQGLNLKQKPKPTTKPKQPENKRIAR
jgi:hypothetical protein